MICENEKCKEEHDGSYGAGRFCCSKCARSFSTKAKRKEINKRVSKKLKGKRIGNNTFTKEQQSLGGKRGSLSKKLKNEHNFKTLSWNKLLEIYCNKVLTKPFRERIKREQNYKCLKCENSMWLDIQILLEIHHKDGNKYNNKRENLEGICPNCHCQTDNWKFRNSKKYKGV